MKFKLPKSRVKNLEERLQRLEEFVGSTGENKQDFTGWLTVGIWGRLFNPKSLREEINELQNDIRLLHNFLGVDKITTSSKTSLKRVKGKK